MKLGSHNSMTYLKPQWYLLPFAWFGRCQSLDIKQQFNAGARWFDLRIAFDNKGFPFFAHGLMSYKGSKVNDILNILDNLANETKEKIYIRLLNERNSDYSKILFRTFCANVVEEYSNLIFTGGQNKKDWKLIYDFGNYPDMPLVDKYSSCNHDKCEYDESGKEINHVNNTGVVIDDICPEWYAKRNNLKNRNKYIDQDVYLLLDFIGKY